MAKKKESSGAWVIIAVVVIVFISIIAIASNHAQREAVKKKCKENDQVYIEGSNTCRDKTVSEKFNEKCISDLTIDGKKYSCAYIKNAGLEKAYLDKTIVRHGDYLYEYGTLSEVQAGKNVGDYCLSAADTWSHIGETRCVVFTPAYFARQGYNYFINEKKDYNNGFVVYMYGNYGWNWFLETYNNKGPILVCGTIVTYRGHPEIKTAPSSILVSPNGTAAGPYTVYKYSCK